MRRARLVISMVLPCQISLSHAARPDVRVIVYSQIGPGVYGRVEIGNAPRPPVVYVTPPFFR